MSSLFIKTKLLHTCTQNPNYFENIRKLRYCRSNREKITYLPRETRCNSL